MSLRLRIEHGQDAGKTYRLPVPGVYTLGRKTDVSLRVLDMKVSGQHCEIRVAGEGSAAKAIIHDLGSTHGCLLNGQPLKRDKALNPGDELRLGMTIMRVLSDGAGDADLAPADGREADMSTADQGDANAGVTKTTLPPDALVGKDLGGYQIERKIGAGGMGGVYLAEQTSLRRKVALKVLNEKFASDSAFVDQFVNEARAAGALNHPNVVQVYDVGSAQGHYFFSMEVMPGGSIEDKVREGPVGWEVALNWFIDASNALIFAKRREILHRDVKPDNLMIGEDESAKLCDLGLAKKSEVSDLMDQGIIGTPHFISPEAIRRKSDIDHRTDLYSLGCSFYRIFTGKNPFPGTTVKDILLGHLNKPVPRINDVNRDVPKEIDEVVAQLMAKDPDDRIQTPEELLRQLDKIRTTYNLEAHGIKPASKKPLIIVAAVAALAIGALSFWIATRDTETGPGDLSPEEQARLLDAERTKAGQRVDTTELQTSFGDLKIELAEGDIEEGDNWKKVVFPALSEKFVQLADTWEGKADTWRSELESIDDTVIREHYATALGTVESVAGKARAEAKGIDDYIAEVKKNLAAYEAARSAALEDLKGAIGGYAKKLAKLMEEARYIDLETSLKQNEIEKILQPLREKQVGRRTLLKEKEDILPLLDKQIPGDKDGKERGKKQVAAAMGAIKRAGDGVIAKAKEQLGEKPGHEQYAQAVKTLNAWLESLPLPLEEHREAAPLVTAAYTRAGKRVSDLKDQLARRDEKLKFEELAHDKNLYFLFLQKVWAPAPTGYLQRLEFTGAKLAAKGARESAKTAGYKQLAADWLRHIEALETAFKNVIDGYPAAWAEDYYIVTDDRGKQKKRKMKDVTAKGFKVGRDEYTFPELGPRWMLANLFFVEAGQPRLKSCAPVDHHGLAVLAEMAIEYDAAEAQYARAKKDYEDEAAAAAVGRRIPQLGMERQAAERWQAVRDWLVAREEEEARFRGMYEDIPLNPDAFPQEERAAALDWTKETEKRSQAILGMYYELKERADLGGTWWGSSLLEQAHADVAYAGEALAPRKPEPPRKEDPPKKDGDGKKDGDKPGDEPGDDDGTKPNGDGKKDGK